MPVYDAPPLTYEEQLVLLEQRGLRIDRSTEAYEVLATVGYTRLSAYWRHLLIPNQPKRFRLGVTFSEVYDRYQFDSRLRQVSLYAISHIEIALRSAIAYELSQAKRSGLWTSELSTFKNPSWHSNLIQRTLVRVNSSQESFAKEYVSLYARDTPMPPAWVTLQFASFGELVTALRQIKETEVRRAIAGRYGIPHEVLLSWLDSIRHLRNACAHHARIWNRNLTSAPAWPKSLARAESAWVSSWDPDERIGESEFTVHRNLGSDRQQGLTFYVASCVMMYLVDRINPRNTFKARLSEALSHHTEEAAIEAGFPRAWKLEPLWS